MTNKKLNKKHMQKQDSTFDVVNTFQRMLHKTYI